MSSSEALFYGNVNFNHIGTSMFAIFHVLTLEGWAEIMYKVRFLHPNKILQLSESNTTISPFVFFPILIFIGAFVLLNLILAVIIQSFEEKKA